MVDECMSGWSNLLQIITNGSLAQRSKVKWLVTSRNLPDIERYLRPDSVDVKVSLEVSADYASKAVAAFVKFKVQHMVAAQEYDPKARVEVQQILCVKAEGTFLWVSLVCKELESVPLYRAQKVLQELPLRLDPLYNRMIEQILVQDTQTVQFCTDILQSINLTYPVVAKVANCNYFCVYIAILFVFIFCNLKGSLQAFPPYLTQRRRSIERSKTRLVSVLYSWRYPIVYCSFVLPLAKLRPITQLHLSFVVCLC